jgi:hypothetical protein
MNFDPHKPPFYGRLPLSSAFYQASKFNHQKMVRFMDDQEGTRIPQ